MRRVLAAFLVGLGLAGCAAPPDAGKGAAIGVIVPLSGPDAASGQQVLEGMRLAAGTGPASFELLPRDSHGSPGVGHRRFQELSDQSRVMAVVGGWSAATARTVAGLAAEREVPFLALSPLAVPAGSGEVPVLALHRLASLGVAGARFAREDLEAMTAGIIRRPAQDAGLVLANAFRREFEAHGGEVAWDVELDPRSRVPSDLPGAAVSVVWILGGGPVAGPASDFGDPVEEAIFLVPEGWSFDGLPSLAASGRPVRWVSFFAPADTTQQVRDFLAACQASSVPSTSAVALGWDAMRVLLDAAREENASRDGLARALRGTGTYAGVTGGAALAGGSDRPAVSAVTSEGLHFLRRVESPVPPAPAPGG